MIGRRYVSTYCAFHWTSTPSVDLQSYEPILLAASNTSKLLRAIEVGREIRVILNAKNADDTATFQITEAIVKRIEAEMAFSGEIKVTPLRETRAEAIVRYSSQMEDGSSSTTPWTITRAEWDGHVRRTTRFMRGVMITSPLLLVLTTPLVIVLVLLRNIGERSFSALGWTDLIPSPLGALFITAYFGLTLWQTIHGVRRARSALLIVSRVWECEGCVCPICMTECAPRTSDGFAPACKHSISRDDQLTLIAIWEAHARKDVATAGRLFAALNARVRNPSLFARARLFFTQGFAVTQDDELPFMTRYRAGMVACMLFAVPAAVSFSFLQFDGLFFVFMLIAGILGIPLIMMGTRSGRIVRARCTSCEQALATPHPTHCPECGGDLARIGAISTSQMRHQPGLMIVGMILMLSCSIGPIIFMTGGGTKLLPSRVLVLLAPHSLLVRYSAYRELATRTLDASLSEELVDQLIDSARPGEGFIPNHTDFLLPSVNAGTLPWSKIDEALEALAGVEIERVSAREQVAELRATLRLGGDVFFLSASPYLVFGGVSFDGGPWIGAATTACDRNSLDPIYRSIAAGTIALAPNEYTIEIPASAQTAAWRGWVILMPFSSAPKLSFDEHGLPAQPQGALRMIDIGGDIQLDK